MQEVVRPAKVDLEAAAQAIRAAVLAEHRVPLYALAFIRRGTLPKTSSGKVQRLAARQKYLVSDLDLVRQWTFAAPAAAPCLWDANGPARPSEQDICTWLRERIAARVNIPQESLDLHQPLNVYIVESITLVALAIELQDWLGAALSPDILYDAPSLASLAQRLANPQTSLSNGAPDSQAGDHFHNGKVLGEEAVQS